MSRRERIIDYQYRLRCEGCQGTTFEELESAEKGDVLENWCPLCQADKPHVVIA